MLMPDVTYEFYYSKFNCGNNGTIPPEEFALYCRKAIEEVSLRLCREPLPSQADSVRLAICEIAELIFSSSSASMVKSESIDGYSVTYSEHSLLSGRICSILEKHLAKHGLLYRGV